MECQWPLPNILHHIPSSKSYYKCKKLYVRDTTLLENEAFLDDLQRNMETLQMQDIKTTFYKFALLFETTLNKHSPLKIMSRSNNECTASHGFVKAF